MTVLDDNPDVTAMNEELGWLGKRIRSLEGNENKSKSSP